MNSSDAPLDGLTVIERTQSVAGAYAGRLLSALGANTVLVEPPEGHRLRRQPPMLAENQSSLFAYLAAGKRSVSLDLRDPADQTHLTDLVCDADIYIDDFSSTERGHTTAPSTFRIEHPQLIYVSVRPYGMTGPKADWDGEEVTILHSTGEGYLLPNGLAYERHPNRAPIKIFGHFAEMQAGIAAVLGTLASLVSGVGQVIDVAIQDAVVALAAFGLQRFGDGSIEHRSARSFKYGGVLECADGYVELLTLEDRQWHGLVTLMGGPEWAADPALADGVGRGHHGAEINDRLRSWARTLKAADLVKAAQELNVPAAKYATPFEVLRDPHEVARGLFQQAFVPGFGDIDIVSAPFQIDGVVPRLNGGPPELPIRQAAIPADTSARGGLR
ncbi:CaiB/BaiF CoA transferase family protein [Microbacterium sp. A93]|uniref:CaiB/BaiF CoA transferase family protein n=1 Tax=Microbacterium sp. A93 TaxID=3450716 RepID=UPI003F436F91